MRPVDRVIEMVQSVNAAAGDPEIAHGLEDELHLHVLNLIADGKLTKAEMQEIALCALATGGADFPRWCA